MLYLIIIGVGMVLAQLLAAVINDKMNATIPGWIIFFSYIAIIAMLIALLIIGISNQNSIHIPNPSLKIFKNKQYENSKIGGIDE